MNMLSSDTPRVFLNREIVRLSIPAIVSNLTVPLLGLSDTAISGHLGAECFLAAIAVGSMMLNVVFWVFGFLRMGTTGMSALAYGRKDHDAMADVFSRSLFIAFALGLMLIVFRIPVAEALSRLIGADGSSGVLARRYFSICIWQAPATLGVMVVSGWFVGCQSTFWPMVIAVSVNIINIALSLLLVFCTDIGFVGVAYGTLIANWAGLLIALFAVGRRCGGFRVLWCGFGRLFDFRSFGLFFKVNSALFFRSLCIIAVSLAVTSFGARQGELILATNAVMMQFFHLFSFFMDGYAYTGEALTGRFAGAHDRRMLRESVRWLLLWTLAMVVIFTVIYVFCSKWIAAMLTDNPEVLVCFGNYCRWVMILPVCAAWAFIFDGFYIGVASTLRMFLATFTATLLFAVVNLLSRYDCVFLSVMDSNDILWLSFILYLAARGIFLAASWPGVSSSLFGARPLKL